MIPLKDNIPSSRFPYVTYGILSVILLVYLYEISIGKEVAHLLHTYGVVPARYHGGEGSIATRILHLFTSMFLHEDPRLALGWRHVVGNMLFLWIFGDNVEDRLGRLRFALLYILSGLAGVMLHFVCHASSTVPVIGASGAVGGVLGAYMITYPRARVITLIPVLFIVALAEIPALIYLAFWFVLQIFMGVGMARAGGGSFGVAFWAHIGGFLAGVALMMILAPTRGERSGVDPDGE
jgi:membrane associated rhomboid family serine protease